MKQNIRKKFQGAFRDINGSRRLHAFPDLELSHKITEETPVQGVVVLLHGVLGKPSNLSLFAASAQKRGYAVMYPSFRFMDSTLHQVTRVLRMLDQLDGYVGSAAVPVHMVGHSLGGVVGVLAAERSRTYVTSVTAIASPLGGSSLAKLSPRGLPMADVAIGRDLVDEVMRARKGSPLFSVAGVRDPLVEVSSAFGLAKSPRSFGCLAVPESHVTVLLSKRVVREVEYFQRRAEESLQLV